MTYLVVDSGDSWMRTVAAMMQMRRLAAAGISAIAVFYAAKAGAAPAPPSGAHPRLFLDGATLATMKEQKATASSGAAQALAKCADARANPSKYTGGGTWTFDWGFVASACGIAYQVGGDEKDAAMGLVYLNALLDDYTTIGDGAGGDTAVTHDTGYAMRNYASYPALAYDWLHDAPGMTETLRAHARARFKAWTDWYGKSGYLPDIAGANYQAGYTFAATLIAVAEAGEAGADGDALWTTVVDEIFNRTLARGFDATAPANAANDILPGGALIGGDWAEGWQYGPLSVIEYALSARALEEQGIALPSFDGWAGDLSVHSVYAQNPGKTGLWVGGDFDSDQHWQDVSRRTLLATVVGNASAEAKGWAKSEMDRVGGHDEALFEALADARKVTAVAVPTTWPEASYVYGTRSLFFHETWDKSAVWAVFTAAPRVVTDHQHFDAGNWALSRGPDDLVVDPSAYGSRSTLTSNAPAVDSSLLGADYTPSQTPWSATADMAWHRVVEGGLVAARANYSDAFRFRDKASDVPVALRDFVLIPVSGNATVVLLDRVETGDAARGMHLRIRTPATLTANGDVATGTVGTSQLSIRKVYTSSGAPAVRAVPADPNGCEAAAHHGSCDTARFAVNEYKLDVSGPVAQAIEVIDGTAAGAAPDATVIEGTGFRGVSVARGGKTYVVVGADGTHPAAPFAYQVTAGAARHVVVDAPVGDAGRSDVAATLAAGKCSIVVTARAGATGGYDGKPLIVDVSDACVVGDVGTVVSGVDAGAGPSDGSVLPRAEGGTGGRTGGAGASGADASSTGGASGAGASGTGGAAGTDVGAAPADEPSGCSCTVAERRTDGAWWALVGVALALLRRRRA